MTTIAEEAAARLADADHAPDDAPTPRVRRFAPRRSRSAAPPQGPEQNQPIPVVDAAAPTPPPAEPVVAEAPPAEERAVKPVRSRTRRKASVSSAEAAAPIDASTSMPTDVPPTPLDEIAEVGAPAEPAPTAAPPARPARGRGRRQTVRAAVTTLPDTEPAAIVAEPPPAVAETPAEAPAPAKRARRPRRQAAPAAVVDQPSAQLADEPFAAETALPLAAQADEAPAAPANTWFPDGEMVETTPGGDLDRLETLARAFLETFPPEAVEAAPVVEPVASTTVDEEAAEPEGVEGALGEPEGSEGGEDALGRRRSRRGRRGGRGRKRLGLAALAPVEAESGAEPAPVAPENGHAAIEQAPPAGAAPAGALFTPEQPPRPTRSWRERGPRRLWGRTYSRDVSAPVVMPPPKPSNGARFAPIPQAVPPRGAPPSEPSVAAPIPLLIPNLRLDEPLAPGETRTERLLEAQTYLLRAMLEQQSRQIETLTSQVSSLSRQMGRLAEEGIGARTYQPRTGIFVDAPNVCYAAEGARVNLDFGRMLRYLSRDRHLVHAFAYSPIIDDVREGIRYETQRFVAPFLRTGYKLVTKPLKRFSDGSAKGNFDIELAVDIVTMSERLDLVVLVSGDSDFERVIEHIQSRGVRVEVVAFASNVSTELVNVADVFIDISQHLEHMRAL